MPTDFHAPAALPPRVRRDEAIEPARLRRGAQLAVKRVSPTQYIVRGSTGTMYEVDLDGDPGCYCRDREIRGLTCKHLAAGALASGDMRFINALAATYEAAVKREREEAEAKAARRAAHARRPRRSPARATTAQRASATVEARD